MIDYKNYRNSKVAIFHHNDLDGIGGKAVIEGYYELKGCKTATLKMDYSENATNYMANFINKFVNGNEEVLIYIVDISFTEVSLDMLNALVDAYPNTVIWLDHHKSSIDLLASKQVHSDKFLDIVLDNTRCGCRIAYEYLYTRRSGIINIIDDWDRFILSDNRTLPFKTFTDSLSEDNLTKDIKTFISLENKEDERCGVLYYKLLEHYIQNGKIILGYLNGVNKKDLEDNAYEIKVNDLKCIVLNKQGSSSIFCSKINKDEYPIAINYYYSSKGEYVYSVTSCDENLFNCTKFAEAHGGGGHPRRSGFRNKELIFKKGEDYRW